jgi:hypothetical protein
MGSDGTKGGPADVPITSDAQKSRGLRRDEVRFVRILSLPDSLRILQA